MEYMECMEYMVYMVYMVYIFIWYIRSRAGRYRTRHGYVDGDSSNWDGHDIYIYVITIDTAIETYFQVTTITIPGFYPL